MKLLDAWYALFHGSRQAARVSFTQAKRLVVLLVGVSVVLVGLAMVALPGPAVLVIPAGLAILATEFIWARRLLNRLKRELKNAGEAIQNHWNDRK